MIHRRRMFVWFSVTIVVLVAMGALVTLPKKVSAYTPHAPIAIVSNADFTAANGVSQGSGTWNDPYIIEGWDINASSTTGIVIANTDAHFIMRDVYVHSGLSAQNGIYLALVFNGVIDNVTVSNNNNGVEIHNSGNLTISSSNILSNAVCGIIFFSSANFSISSSNVSSNGQMGILLADNTNLSIFGNTISSNSENGIDIHSQPFSNASVSGNNIFSNGLDGIYLLAASNISISYNNIFSNHQFGIDTSSAGGITIFANNISWNGHFGSGGFSGINLLNSNDFSISANNVFSNNASGIKVIWSINIVIASNDVSSNLIGIDTAWCTNVSISANNVFSNGAEGIGSSWDYSVSITANSVFSNGQDGILLFFSVNVRVSSCKAFSNGFSGLELIYSTNVSISSNSAFMNRVAGIYLWYSGNISISSNNVSSNGGSSTFLPAEWDGILFVSSTNVSISWNDLSSNIFSGILGSESTNVSISANEVHLNNVYGICLDASSGVSIYHNNLIDNPNQAYDNNGVENSWDNGYPSGGNHWSDYTGSDAFNGPNQDIPGSDGIGDVPYIIDADSRDRYPLMKPTGFSVRLPLGHRFVSFPVKVVNESIQSVLSSISGCYDYVRWYDPLDPQSPWKSYVLGRGTNSLLKLDNTMGFWINMTSACSLSIAGTRPYSTTISLHHGWNMVGFPSFNTTYTVADLKSDLGLAGVVVESFDSTAAPYFLQRVSDGYMMETGEGYWVYVPSDTTWVVNG